MPSTVAGTRKSSKTTRTVRSSQLMLIGAREDIADHRVHPERAERQERAQGEQRPDGPAGLDPVGQPAAQHVTQADAAQDDPDHAGPDRQRRAHVPRHQPAGDQLEDHDAQAAEKRQSIRQESLEGTWHGQITPVFLLTRGQSRTETLVWQTTRNDRLHHIRRKDPSTTGQFFNHQAVALYRRATKIKVATHATRRCRARVSRTARRGRAQRQSRECPTNNQPLTTNNDPVRHAESLSGQDLDRRRLAARGPGALPGGA